MVLEHFKLSKSSIKNLKPVKPESGLSGTDNSDQFARGNSYDIKNSSSVSDIFRKYFGNGAAKFRRTDSKFRKWV